MSSFTSNSKISKYLVRVVLFLVFIFLFDRGLYYLLLKAESEFYIGNKFEEKFSQFVSGKDYNTLIFGTSRTYDGIIPFYLQFFLKQRIYKDAFQGKGPKYNYYLYKMFKKYNGVPKVVIYGVDYFIYTIKSDPKWMSQFDLKEEEKVDLFSAPLLLLKNKKRIDNFQNNILIRLQEQKSKEENEEDFKDFVKVQEHKGAAIANKKLITKEPPEFLHQDFPVYPGEEGAYFVKLLEELDRDGVTVLLIALPDFVGSHVTNVQLDKFIADLEAYRTRFKKLYVYNFNKFDKFPLWNENYFNDGGYGMTNSHLSPEGARLFSEMLAKEIKKHYAEE